jgi:DNA invertase Pin-like site-specific DNA recombinase
VLLDGYIRVSRAAGREHFVSADLQRKQIEGWVRAHDATLANLYEFDKSGAGPLLIEALERVETGESDGLIVARLERLGRSAAEALQTIRRIEEVGGTLVSVQDGFDIRTLTGKLTLRVLLSIGEWELSADGVASTVACRPGRRR